MATGILSKGITLSYNSGTDVSPVWTVLTDLQKIPDLGADAEQVEVTTLADAAKRYIAGIKDYGSLEFQFLYANGTSDSFRILKGIENAGTIKMFKIILPDTTSLAFSGNVVTKIAGVAVNEALTFTAAISLNTDMVVTNPA